MEIPANLIGEGFSITNGVMVDRSMTFNVGTPYHDNANQMHKNTFEMVRVLVHCWMRNDIPPGRNLKIVDRRPWEYIVVLLHK